MNCQDVGFATWDCVYHIKLPYLVRHCGDEPIAPESKYVAIDKCLLPEIIQLWEMGIKTTGCCCGHGRRDPFIGVGEEFIPKMKKMGYEVYFNPCRPHDEDEFVPKTFIRYGEINKGFCWKDEISN